MRNEALRPLAHQPARHERPSLHDEMRQLLTHFVNGDATDSSSVVTSQWTPRVDIREERDRFVILADLPGIDPADVEVWMDKGVLSLKGERKPLVGEGADGESGEVRFSRVERSTGRFHRRFTLPDSADADGVTASGYNGVLEISIPKRPETTPRRIEVGAASGAGTRQ